MYTEWQACLKYSRFVFFYPFDTLIILSKVSTEELKNENSLLLIEKIGDSFSCIYLLI